MSADAIQAVLSRSYPRGAQRVVLFVIAHHASDEWVAYVSLGQLVRQTKLSPGAVHSAVAALVRAGDLAPIRQDTKDWNDKQGFRLLWSGREG